MTSVTMPERDRTAAEHGYAGDVGETRLPVTGERAGRDSGTRRGDGLVALRWADWVDLHGMPAGREMPEGGEV